MVKHAKEMFEELGYELNESYDKNMMTYISIQNVDGERHFGITFNLNSKSYHCWHFGYDEQGHCDNGMNLSINMKLLKAINKQVEELGWSDVKN